MGLTFTLVLQRGDSNACAEWIRYSMHMLFKMLWGKKKLLAFSAKPESNDCKEEK